MNRIWIIVSVLILATLSALAWAENPAVGKWSCTSVDANGNSLNWTLIVKEDGGKISASIADLPDGSGIETLEPKLEGDTLTFKVPMNPEETVELSLKIDGKNLAGTFAGKSSGKGTVKGAKQS